MKLDEQIRTRLKKLVNVPTLAFPAIVDEVDREHFTCTVTPIGEAVLFDVRLKAGIEEVDDGMVEIPAMNSSVLVVLIGNDIEDAFVAKCSQVDEVLFYGGKHSGLIKAKELVSQLEKVNAYLESIKAGFDSWLPAPGDGGASLRTHMVQQLAAQQTGDYSNIENQKVKH